MTEYPAVPLRRAARILNGGTPPSGDLSLWGGDVPFVTPPDLNGLDGRLLHTTARAITEEGVAHSGVAPRGSVLLSTRAPVGHIGRPSSRVAFNQGCRALVPNGGFDARYLAYTLVAARSELDARALGTTFLELSGSSLASVDVPRPSLTAQRAIADYLDRETAQIDAFIAKNEELIALIAERRSAVVDLEVTGGRRILERPRPSRWFGQVPGDWRLLPVKGVSRRVTDGAHISPETEGGVFDFVSTRDVGDGQIDFEGSLKTSPGSYDYMVRTGCRPYKGDVLYSKDGTIGATAVVREDREFVVASSLVIISPSRATVHPEYLRYALSARPTLEQARTLVRGAGLPRLSVANLGRVVIPVPPLEEQVEIVAQLDSVVGSSTDAFETARRAIELARERRAALISAAVTGKIDVGVAA